MTLSLRDRLAIHELLALHGHLVDEGRLDSLDCIFSRDVVYDLSPLGGPVLSGVEAIIDAALELGEGNPVAHHVTNVVISDAGDGSACVQSKGIAVRSDGSVGSVVYADLVERTPDGWRIARRVVRLRSRPLTAG
jgi:hypothetical protein